jgi:hypothetical protein
MMAGASTASAGFYCNPYAAGGFGTCAGPFQSLSSNVVIAQFTSYTTCAGAADSLGNFYGQYFCASNYSCHTYGGEGLYPYAHNHESVAQSLAASTNGSVTLTCPHGGPTSRAAAADLAGTGVTSYVADGQRCLQVQDGTAGYGITCADRAVTDRQGLVGVLKPGADKTGDELPDAGTLYALAPSGATSATLVSSNGRTSRVAVDDGVVRAALSGAERTVKWDTSATPVAVP